jgi:hypothetical protein
LTPGDTFRIAFVTDATTTATSTSIADYNDFVNADATTEAVVGSVTYNGILITFSAIGSTEAVSAISNIGQTGAPVYLVDGTAIASSDTPSSGGLWSGALFAPLSEDLSGSKFGAELVWTGTEQAGTASAAFVLGSTAAPTLLGDSTDSGPNWINVFGTSNRSNEFPMYGISSLLTVPGVPEPSTIVIWGVMLGCGAVGANARRRWQNRRVR